MFIEATGPYLYPIETELPYSPCFSAVVLSRTIRFDNSLCMLRKLYYTTGLEDDVNA